MDEINVYSIEKVYSDMEKYLIKNIKANLTDDLTSFHLKEEKELGFKWEAWQTAKLKDLQKFRKQNKDIINARTKNIDKKIAKLINKEALQGKISSYKNFREAIGHGYKSSIQIKDSFFKTNGRKVRSLIKSVTNDFNDVNHATLRRSNDIYRQIIHEASMYNTSGVMTSEQAIRKAISDFELRGINSIVYKNGSRHRISEYASMALRTASTRSQLAGEGELRQKIGSPLIIISKHNTSCKLCQPWEGKVLIDDVYSSGTKEDGKYTLLSEAMKQGLYHPNCRHGHGTYFPELSKNTNQEVIKKIEKETIEDLPLVVDKVEKNVLYHGFEKLEHAIQFQTGKLFTKKHEYGTGFYATTSNSTAHKYNEGYISKLTLFDDANIGNYATLMTEMLKTNYKDVGIYAKSKGYDAIKIKGTNYIIILNRKKVIVEKIDT